MIEFKQGSVPIAVVARIYGKDKDWVRSGIIFGWLPIGTATKNGEVVKTLEKWNSPGRTNFYISPKLLYEQTGYIWKGEKK